jgi:hypothetical protein
MRLPTGWQVMFIGEYIGKTPPWGEGGGLPADVI